MKRLVAPLLALLVVAGIAALSAFGARRADALLTAPCAARSDWPVIVEVPRGASAGAVARQLRSENLVADARVLRLWMQASGQAQRIQAGEYAFEKPMSVLEVADLLVSGKVVLHPVTVPEGLTLEETAERLAGAAMWTKDALLQAFRNPAPVRDLDPAATDLEGYLFPDTYNFPKGEPASSVAAAMVKRFRQAWAEAGGPALSDGRSVRDVATLASLVEKETARPDEHGLVASVYWNRLRNGMRLECDPTVIKALQEAGQWTGGPLQIRDLSFPSPWNTYLNAGLPPGPIASFGLPSLRAAMQPAPSEYVFFVATGEGGHRFAATLKEHQQNVKLYRAVQREERKKERAQAAAPGGR